MRRFTTIDWEQLHTLEVSIEQYCLADTIAALSQTDNSFGGWCVKKVTEIGADLGIKRASTYRYVDHLIKAGLIVRDSQTGHLKATKKWYLSKLRRPSQIDTEPSQIETEPSQIETTPISNQLDKKDISLRAKPYVIVKGEKIENFVQYLQDYHRFHVEQLAMKHRVDPNQLDKTLRDFESENLGYQFSDSNHVHRALAKYFANYGKPKTNGIDQEFKINTSNWYYKDFDGPKFQRFCMFMRENGLQWKKGIGAAPGRFEPINT